MPKEKIWATIYEDDDEAFEIWKEIGMPEERIVRLGKDDNFWEIGLGPCGPCSEIYFDRGEEYGCDEHDCKPGCDCDRYIEFWNHVFTQFSKEEDGSYSNLAHPNIDTGMGLERLACIMQGVDSIFDIDTIKYILDAVVEKSGIPYGNGKAKTDVSIRIITDHIRSVTFMISDDILPSNEGRGYVLRRLLRRAARHGKILDIEGKFLSEMAEKVIEVSGGAYPELVEKREYIKKIISIEEEKFSTTIDQGTAIINEYVSQMKGSGTTVLSGEKAFKLHDTYGFPLELTSEILAENGCTVDIEEFNKHMLEQKEKARAARGSVDDDGWAEDNLVFSSGINTVFTGYETLTDKGTVTAILINKAASNSAIVGDEAKVIFHKTPFYAESGGQTYDSGIVSGNGFKAEVIEVSKVQGNFLHKLNILEGSISVGDEMDLQVYVSNRHHIARNHTATHILQKALQSVVGDHVHQAGSSVNADNLRFDFNHYEALTKEQLFEVEKLVNEKIMEFLPVEVAEMSMEEAAKLGATALFGEKYGDRVRVVSVGDFSKELCGGTHVSNSGLIGSFKITSESGVAAGVRRIEAVTGMAVNRMLSDAEQIVEEVAAALKSNKISLIAKANSISEEVKALKKELDTIKKDSISSSLDSMLNEATDIGDVKILTKKFTDFSINDLRQISDDIKKSHKGYILVFATVNEDKVTFMVSITDDLLEKGYHAGNMIKQIAAAAGGGGGGKADMAQAGAKDPSKIEEAFKTALQLVENK